MRAMEDLLQQEKNVKNEGDEMPPSHHSHFYSQTAFPTLTTSFMTLYISCLCHLYPIILLTHPTLHHPAIFRTIL